MSKELQKLKEYATKLWDEQDLDDPGQIIHSLLTMIDKLPDETEPTSPSLEESDIRQVVEKIFYSPATNGKAERSIADGVEAIKKLITGALQQNEDYKNSLSDTLEWLAIFHGALSELIELKRIKDTEGKTDDYLERQPKAWHAAEQSLDLWKKNDYKESPPPSDNCSKHKKELFGQTDMKVVAEVIGDLHYDSLRKLLYELHAKLWADAAKDRASDRIQLADELSSAAFMIGSAYMHMNEVWKICKPFMNS